MSAGMCIICYLTTNNIIELPTKSYNPDRVALPIYHCSSCTSAAVEMARHLDEQLAVEWITSRLLHPNGPILRGKPETYPRGIYTPTRTKYHG